VVPSPQSTSAENAALVSLVNESLNVASVVEIEKLVASTNGVATAYSWF
jgi:hypothetical protein